jgi:hypothetical protein
MTTRAPENDDAEDTVLTRYDTEAPESADDGDDTEGHAAALLIRAAIRRPTQG